MKLEPDCIRAVLLQVEKLGLNETYSLEQLCRDLPRYGAESVEYTVLKLQEAGFLIVTTTSVFGRALPLVLEVRDITYRGHEFLNDVRTDKNWAKIKRIAAKAGSFSLTLIGHIAQEVAANAVSAALKQSP